MHLLIGQVGHAETLVRSPRRWYVKPCMAGKAPPPLSSQPTPQELTIYLHWFCPVKHLPNSQTTSSTRPILLFWGITEPFVLGDEMTKSGGLVRLLMSRSQHVSLSRIELLEVMKDMIVPFDPSAFFAIERLPLQISARICLEISQHILQKYASSPVFYDYESCKAVSTKRK